MAHEIRPFLMFEGQAEAAMRYYVSLFPDAEILALTHYGPAGPGKEGSVQKGLFRLGAQSVMCTDSFVRHEFTFTPAFSLFVTCESAEEIRRLASALSDGGKVLMPLGSYAFSRQFAWVNDRYGVSWQLNLE